MIAFFSTVLFLLSVFFALPMLGANATDWNTSPDDNGVDCRYISENGKCFWVFDTAGQSPLIDKRCSVASLRTTGGVAHPYVCHDTTFANCLRIESTNLSTGVFGPVVLNSTDPVLLGVPWSSILIDVQSGSGIITAECGG